MKNVLYCVHGGQDVLFVRCWQCGVKFVNLKWNLSKDFQLLLWEVKSCERRWKPNQLQYRDLLRLQEGETKLRKIGTICLWFTMCSIGRHWIIASKLLCLASSGWNLLPWRDWTFDDKTPYARVITRGNKTEEKSIIFKKSVYSVVSKTRPYSFFYVSLFEDFNLLGLWIWRCKGDHSL